MKQEDFYISTLSGDDLIRVLYMCLLKEKASPGLGQSEWLLPCDVRLGGRVQIVTSEDSGGGRRDEGARGFSSGQDSKGAYYRQRS